MMIELRGISIAIARVLPAVLLGAAAFGQDSLPEPPKPDVPYLIHATQLVEVEQSEAVEEAPKKNQLMYTVAGASSGVKTPLAGPEFLIKAENLDPHEMQLYRFESNKGRRELLFRKKKKLLAMPIITSVFPLEKGLFRIRVDETLDLGEYCLTPNGSNAVFCFAVY